MIEAIELKNYQSHKRSIINLAEGLNIFTGSSDAGKSSILRGVRWALVNRPVGFDFKSDFSDDKALTVSAIQFDDGYILREKGDRVNRYELPEDTLGAIGTDLPDRVIETSNMDETNIKTQDERYYLLQETPAQRAKILNKAAGLEDIDEAIFNANAQARRCSKEVDIVQRQFDELDDKLGQYTDVAVRLKQVGELVFLAEKLRALEDYEQELTSVLAHIIEAEDMMRSASILFEAEDRYKELEKLVSEIDTLALREKRLNTSIYLIKKLEKDITSEEAFLVAEEPFNRLNKLGEDIWVLESRADNLDKILRNVYTTDTVVKDKDGEVTKVKAKAEDTIWEHGFCPLCGTDIEEEMIPEIIKGFLR